MMRISIITIAYNSEKSIGHTIESVLRQELGTGREQAIRSVSGQEPEEGIDETDSVEEKTGSGFSGAEYHGRQVQMEYIIIDGKSSDHTVEVAESYRPLLENKGIRYRIYSEPDKGIYDAMNKGILLAEGDVIGILNSDDWYEPETIQTVADVFSEKHCDLMYANIRMYRTDGSTFIKKARSRRFQTSRDWNHPTTFVKAQIYKENLFRNLGIHDDYGFFLQMKRQGRQIVIVDKVLANFRMGGASNRKDFKAAGHRILDRYKYCYRINGYSRWYIMECIAIEAAKMLLG